MLRRRPNVRNLVKKEDVTGLTAALQYHDYVTDTDGRRLDLGAIVRRDAAVALGNGAMRHDPEVGQELWTVLGDPSTEVRVAAIRALRARGETSAIPLLTVAALQARGSESPGPVAAVAGEAVIHLSVKAGAELFVDTAIREDGNPDTAHQLLLAIIQAGRGNIATEAAQSAAACLLECDGAARERAASFLAWLGANGLEPLIRALENGPTRLAAIKALGSLRDVGATPHLVRLLSEEDPEVRRAAAVALGVISDPQAASALLAAASDPVFEVRKAAQSALEMIGPAAQADLLGSAADSSEPGSGGLSAHQASGAQQQPQRTDLATKNGGTSLTDERDPTTVEGEAAVLPAYPRSAQQPSRRQRRFSLFRNRTR